jgi:selenide,water dikinase
MLAHGAHSATDVTGYGLVGHAGEMARASGVALAFDARSVSLLDGVLDLIARDAVPGGTRDNLAEHARFTHYADGVDEAHRIALSDAQTSGGLLIAIPRAGAERIVAELHDLGTAAIVGEVLDGPAGTVFVR